MSYPVTEGFILTAWCRDHQDSMRMEIWVKTDDGPVKLIIDDQRPCFFVRATDLLRTRLALRGLANNVEFRPVALKTFQQQDVVCCYTTTLSDFFEARKCLAAIHIERFEDDIQTQDRYLMERFICGSLAFTGEVPSTSNHPWEVIEHAKTRPADKRPQMSWLSLDIECSTKGELFSVGLYRAQSEEAPDEYRQVIMIGEPESGPEWIHWVDDESNLLQTLCEAINADDPDLIIGWNVINFDFRLLIQRATLYDLPLDIGRDGSPAQWRDSRNDSRQGFIDIAGRKVIDGIHALKSETYHFQSFSLENVARELLGIGKKIENPHDRLAEIVHDFHHNKVKLSEYNLQDCILVDKIFRKTRILDFLMFRYQLTGLPLDKQGGSVAAFTNLYLPLLHRAGYVSPNLPTNGGLASPGGYVMDSRPGLYDHVLVLDYKSLYPSIIRTFKVDPMGLIEGLKHPGNAIEGFNGAMFSRDKHYLPSLVERLGEERDQAKKDGDKERSQAIKIFMSSFYGVLGSGGCRFYDRRLSSSITLRGHEIMQTTRQWIEQEGYQVIYGDTDSTFVWVGDAATNEQDIANIGTQLQNIINERWHRLLKNEKNLESYLEIEFESHYHRFFMPTIRNSEQGSKKRYAGLIVNSDGGHQMIFKGLENARTDWTQLAREFQAELYETIFLEQDPVPLIVSCVKYTLAGANDEKLVYHKRLRRPALEYTKSIPPHVRAALIADEKNQSLDRPYQYDQKTLVSYVMTLNGPQTVDYTEADLDYTHYLEKQLKPVADAILPILGLDFDTITTDQLSLF
ncbi:DNA polymerase II [BD1-7 clade bacterium]|uniref:DNA polymerase n=1 Tax=BD1-7 clade bacterium TaxID=2029982 RepID=A0A5S9QHQ5_9GAMM|nr:DNA polymerase II [BD1-7 clade bacterium]CAA0117441.1 DNA polymerase II [BD1-7 clade bacterium]